MYLHKAFGKTTNYSKVKDLYDLNKKLSIFMFRTSTFYFLSTPTHGARYNSPAPLATNAASKYALITTP